MSAFIFPIRVTVNSAHFDMGKETGNRSVNHALLLEGRGSQVWVDG